MKRLILPFILFLSLYSFVKAQTLPVDSKTGKITYIEVVDATGMTAKDIFTAAKDWGTSKGYTIKSENEGTGELIFEGKLPVDYMGVKGKPEKGNVNHTFSIFIKDGKYRYIVTDFVHEGADNGPSGGKLESSTAACGPGRMTSASWLFIKKKTQSGIEAQIADLKRVIKEIQNDPAKKTDW